MITKVCSKCNTELPITDYYTLKTKTGKTYTYNYCKKCHYRVTKPIAKKWRKDNPERWIKDVLNAQKLWKERQDGGIYLLQTTDGLYVGQTSCLKTRLAQHEQDQTVGIQALKKTKLLSVTVLKIENDEEKRLNLEKRYIKLLKPELNLMFNPDYKKTYRGSFSKKK
jgi:predicted GIY-YIG superfamily endonuclease